MESKIIKFIKRHHVMTLATLSKEGAPYCSNAFYSFDSEGGRLIFASNSDTLHAEQMVANPHVAASIVLESKVVGKLQGVQICGEVAAADGEDRLKYIAAFPYAAVAPLTLWRLTINYIKLTDNTLGFGKKLIWKRE